MTTRQAQVDRHFVQQHGPVHPTHPGWRNPEDHARAWAGLARYTHGIENRPNPEILAAGRSMAPDPVAFDLATDSLDTDEMPTDDQIAALRASLPPDAQMAFDMALALRRGHHWRHHPDGLTPQGLAAYFMTHGLAGNQPGNNQAIMQTIVSHGKDVHHGAALAIEHRKSWLPDFLRRFLPASWF